MNLFRERLQNKSFRLLLRRLLSCDARTVLKLIEERKVKHGASLAINESMALDPKAPKVDSEPDRELLLCVARTTLRTKLTRALADNVAEICVDAVLCVRQPQRPIDLYMVEIQVNHRIFLNF